MDIIRFGEIYSQAWEGFFFGGGWDREGGGGRRGDFLSSFELF